MSRWSAASDHIDKAVNALILAEERNDEVAVLNALRSIAHSQLALAQYARMTARPQ